MPRRGGEALASVASECAWLMLRASWIWAERKMGWFLLMLVVTVNGVMALGFMKDMFVFLSI